MSGLLLNFACGGTRWPGFQNSDIHGREGTSHVDLEQLPYPYPDSSAGLILISHALWLTNHGTARHPDLPKILREFHRILEPDGWLRVDDNPWRCWDDTTPPITDAERLADFPVGQRTRRVVFVQMILEAGFRYAIRCTEGTRIECEPEVLAAVLGNRLGRESFTVEARK